MSTDNMVDKASGAARTVAAVTARIEGTFAQVGDHLGRSHAIFEGLQRDLAAISAQLSGADMASASTALQAIAARLTVTLSMRVRAPIAPWVTPPVSATTATSRHSGMESPNSARYVRAIVSDTRFDV